MESNDYLYVSRVGASYLFLCEMKRVYLTSWMIIALLLSAKLKSGTLSVR